MIALVYNAGYKQLAVSLFTMHDQFIPPPPPVPLPGVPGVFEGMVHLGWPAGFLSHKKAPTVLVDGYPGLQQGHDVGMLIPHVAAPPNSLMAVHMLLSKHKLMFPVSSVLLEGKPVGTNLLGFLDLICCNPVSLPTGGTVVIKCTVQTSASLGDILKGLFYIAVEAAFDYVWGKLTKGLPKLANSKWGQEVFEYLGGTWLGRLPIRMLVSPLVRGLGGGYFPPLASYQDILRGKLVGEAADRLLRGVVKNWGAGPIVTGGVEHGNPVVRPAGWKPFDKDNW